MSRGLLLAFLFVLSACSGHQHANNGTPSPSAPLTQPVTINLYPSTDSSRLYVLIMGVGDHSARLSLALDTGSSGITMDATALFPMSVVRQSGFIFPSGQDTISYNGITITKLGGSREYGGSGGTTKNGNLGFTQVTFGDASGALTTDTIPIFFNYSITRTGSPGTVATATHKQGWFGINTTADRIVANAPAMGSVANQPCAMDSGDTCYVVSVLKYLHYVAPLDAGFALAPSSLQTCDITVVNLCVGVPMLTVGLMSAEVGNFIQVSLNCAQTGYLGPPTIQGYAICQSGIAGTQVAITAADGSVTELTENALFDSGNQAVSLTEPDGPTIATTLPAGSSIAVSPAPTFTYAYIASALGPTETSVGADVSTGIGVNFFTQHSFLIDFTTSMEGFL